MKSTTNITLTMITNGLPVVFQQGGPLCWIKLSFFPNNTIKELHTKWGSVS